VIEWGRRERAVERVCGIVKPGNLGSIRVLEKLGLKYDRRVTSPEGLESSLYI
jgi:RimJ/RimL family protein N-acetyltransferase